MVRALADDNVGVLTRWVIQTTQICRKLSRKTSKSSDYHTVAAPRATAFQQPRPDAFSPARARSHATGSWMTRDGVASPPALILQNIIIQIAAQGRQTAVM